MLLFPIYYFGYFIFDKLTGKLQLYLARNTIKLIKYTTEWHEQYEKIFNLIDWVLL